MPRLRGHLSTVTPRAAATRAVGSVDPSSTTQMSHWGAYSRRAPITWGRLRASLKAGTMARTRKGPAVTGLPPEGASTVLFAFRPEDTSPGPRVHKIGRAH